MLDNRALQIFYSTQGALDTRHACLLYNACIVRRVAKAVRRLPGIGGDVKQLSHGSHVAEAHNKGSPCPFACLEMVTRHSSAMVNFFQPR